MAKTLHMQKSQNDSNIKPTVAHAVGLAMEQPIFLTAPSRLLHEVYK